MRTKRRSRRRTNKNSKNSKNKIFLKYSKTKNHLTKKEIISLMKKEFKLNYNNHVIGGLMNIWGTKINNELVITKSTFIKLFRKPDGFFRAIYL